MIEFNSSRTILGLGLHSTAYYLKRIHQKYKEHNFEFSTCPLILYQIDFQSLNPFFPNQFSELKPRLMEVLNHLTKLGMSKILLPNITLHETFDQLETSVKICHAVDLTIDHLQKNDITEITLFGTLYTMNSDYLQSKFSEKNIEIILPTLEDQQTIDDFRKKVYGESESPSEIDHFEMLMRKYAKNNPVVIACTELSIYSLKNEKSIVDMAELQIDAFIE